ncbi:MAG: beta-eliminating lyase-related protein, partial [Bacteroidia bacterium]
MSAEQWAGMMRGDESYAGASSYYNMKESVYDLTGMPYFFPTHQGRAGERILYTILGGKNKIFLSNTHFDTTRANIEYSGAEAIDIPIEEGLIPSLYHPFKGNMDVKKLNALIDLKGSENIGAVIITVTNNSGGGQPVSLQNIKEISKICKAKNVKLILDCCRIAENAYFIKEREKEYENLSCKEIAQQIFSLC